MYELYTFEAKIKRHSKVVILGVTGKDSRSRLEEIGGNSIIYMFGEVLTRGVSFLLIPLYAKYLSPSEFGRWGVLLALVSFFNILLPLQLNSALTLNYFQSPKHERKTLISTIWFLVIGGALIQSALLLFLGRSSLSDFFQEISYLEFMLVVLIAFSGVFSVLPKTLMRLRQQAFRFISYNAFFYLIGVFVGLFLLIRSDFGVLGILKGMAVANFIAVFPYIWMLKKELTFKISWRIAYSSLIVSLPVLPHMLSHWGLNLMDRIILQANLSLDDVGIYHLGYQLGSVFQVIVISVNSAWTPYFLEKFGDSDSHREIKRISSSFLVVQLWLALFLLLFTPFITKNFFSPEYASAQNVTPWVILGFVFVGFYQYWVNIILYRQKTMLVFLSTGISVLVNLSLNLILVPRYGYLAAGYSTAISYMLLAFITYLFSLKISDFSYDYSRWGKSVFIAGLIYLIASQLRFSNSFCLLIIKFLLAFSFPILLYFWGFWTKSEVRGAFLWLRGRWKVIK